MFASQIERLFKLGNYRGTEGIVVMAESILSVHAMYHRLSLRIGFNAEGSVAVAVRLHLLAIESLTQFDYRLHRIDHLRPIRPVVRQKIDQTYRAGFAHVKIRRTLGRRTGVIPPPPLVVVGRRRNASCRQAGRKHDRLTAGERKTPSIAYSVERRTGGFMMKMNSQDMVGLRC